MRWRKQCRCTLALARTRVYAHPPHMCETLQSTHARFCTCYPVEGCVCARAQSHTHTLYTHTNSQAQAHPHKYTHARETLDLGNNRESTSLRIVTVCAPLLSCRLSFLTPRNTPPRPPPHTGVANQENRPEQPPGFRSKHHHGHNSDWASECGARFCDNNIGAYECNCDEPSQSDRRSQPGRAEVF